MTKFELTILGTSSAFPTSKRYPTAHVLNIRERFFLIDCGEGTQIQLRKYHQKYSRIQHIFISHLHGDHYYGLIGLISTYLLQGRKGDLHIYSPSQLYDLLKPQIDFMGVDLPFKIVWHPLNFKKEQVILDNEVVSVKSFPVKHRIPCCGFLFTEKFKELNLNKAMIEQLKIPVKYLHLIKQGADYCLENGTIIENSRLTLPPAKPRSYAFVTDTVYLPELAELLKDVELLYHEATYESVLHELALSTYHTTAHQAALMAKNANAEKLIIGHFSARYKNTDNLLKEAKQIFENSFLAEEGAVHNIAFTRTNHNGAAS